MKSTMFWAMNRFFLNQSRLRIYLLAFFSVTLLGLIDYLTGWEMSFSIFYLAPIFMVAWYINFRSSLSISVFSTAVMITADVLSEAHYPHPVLAIWNEVARFGFLVIVSFLAAELKKHLMIERNLARIDTLTKIPNRRSFFEELTRQIHMARRNDHPMTVAFIDIDKFKLMNDIFGHKTGDLVLTVTAETIQSQLRSSDVVARLGGDEFAVLLPHTTGQISETVMEKVKNALDEQAAHHNWPISYSMGVVTYMHPPVSHEEILGRADELMYACKNNPRISPHHKVIGQSSPIPRVDDRLLQAMEKS